MDRIFLPIAGKKFILSFDSFPFMDAIKYLTGFNTLHLIELVHILGKRTGLDYIHLAEHSRGQTSILR